MSAHAEGDRIGPFILTRLVGAGGFSEVWRTRDLRGGPIALKLLVHPEHAATVREEARSLSVLRGAGIVGVRELDLDHDPPWIALDYMRGGDLRRRLTDGPLDPARALSLIERLLEHLARVHREGVVHGDLKPENVLFGGAELESDVRLADFGLSRRVSQATATLSVSLSREDARLAGTLEYMSLEQRGGARPTACSDVYAMGVIFHEVLLGARPVGFESLAARAPHLPTGIERVLRLALATSPHDRPRDAGELLRVLRAALWQDARILRVARQGLAERTALLEATLLMWGLSAAIALAVCAGRSQHPALRASVVPLAATHFATFGPTLLVARALWPLRRRLLREHGQVRARLTILEAWHAPTQSDLAPAAALRARPGTARRLARLLVRRSWCRLRRWLRALRRAR